MSDKTLIFEIKKISNGYTINYKSVSGLSYTEFYKTIEEIKELIGKSIKVM